MEGLVGLSVACNIVQVVDFGLKVVSKVRQIYQNGATVEEQDFQANARELASWTDRLKASINEAGLLTNSLPDDKALYELSTKCHSTALELLSELQKAARGPGSGFTSSIYHTLKLLRRSRRIREIHQRLLSYKNLLDLGILVQLFQRSKRIALENGDRFLSLDASLQKFIAGIAQGFSKTDDLVKHEARYIHDSITAEGNSVRDHVTIVGASIIKEFRDIQLDRGVREQHEALLRSLVFPEINLRQEQIADAYRNTYEWIFSESERGVLQDKSATDPHPWHSFVGWLEAADANIYWIYGRAGAGKSTLMSFIYSDDRTKRHLSRGTNQSGNPYILVSFFFWKSGNVMQKTTRGLLQSLLYQILSEDQAALARAVPQSSTSHISPPYLAWSSPRLQRLLSSTLKSLSRPICILLDGIDELDEDEEELLDIIEFLREDKNLKLCIASRPLRSFENRFGGCPRLRLQDLTRNDLRLFVTETLSKSRSFNRMKESHPKDMSDMVESILWLAQGGFLWTKLVVKDLIKGMDNKDSLEVLAERIQSTPTGVDDIYERMWSRLRTDLKYYEEEAMLYFRLILRSEVSLLEFTILTDQDVQRKILDQGSSEENIDFIVTRCEDKRVHALVRGAGLLEVGETTFDRAIGRQSVALKSNSLLRNLHEGWRVRLSHRSIADFLDRKMRLSTEIHVVDDLNLRLRARCMLWLLVPVESVLMNLFGELLWMEDEIKSFVPDKLKRDHLLPNIYHTMHFVEETYLSVVKRSPANHELANDQTTSFTVDFLGGLINRADPIGPLYVRRRLEETPSVTTEILTALLYHATLRSTTFAVSRLMMYFLERGANPNVTSNEYFSHANAIKAKMSAWQMWISILWETFPSYWNFDRPQFIYTIKSIRPSYIDLARCFPVCFNVEPHKKWPRISWTGPNDNRVGLGLMYKLLVKTNAASILRRMLRSSDLISSLDRDIEIKRVYDCFEPVMMYAVDHWKPVVSKEDSEYLVELGDNAFWQCQLSSQRMTNHLTELDPALLDDLSDEFDLSTMIASDIADGIHLQKLLKELPRMFDNGKVLTDRHHSSNEKGSHDSIEHPDELLLHEFDWKPTGTRFQSAAVDTADYPMHEVSAWTREGVGEVLKTLCAFHGGLDEVSRYWNIPNPILHLCPGQLSEGDDSVEREELREEPSVEDHA